MKAWARSLEFGIIYVVRADQLAIAKRKKEFVLSRSMVTINDCYASYLGMLKKCL